MNKNIFIVLLFLTAGLIALAFSLYKDKDNLSVLTYSYEKNVLKGLKKGEMLKGEKVVGEFEARENNLGIISIGFKTYGRVNRDTFIFRMKEKNKDKWYYVNTYDARQFGGYPIFPFGFPVISNAKGKTYIFELESQKGTKENAVGISTEEPVIITKHTFAKKDLLSDNSLRMTFVISKISSIIEGKIFIPTFFLSSILLISPFLLFKSFPDDVFSFVSFKNIKKRNIKKRNFRISVILDNPVVSLPIKITKKIRTGFIFFYNWLGKE